MKKPTFILSMLLSPILLSLGCSSAQKAQKVSALSGLEGKKIALISVEGEETSKKIVEVALVNQLIRKGSFNLVPKQEVEAARAEPQQNPMDWKGIAARTGADYALVVHVLDFSADTREGYSTEEIYDSQLAAEQGTDGKTQRVFKLKSMEGHVKMEIRFRPVGAGADQSGTAEASQRVEENARSSSIHLPPKLRFLEELSNRAFKEFFDRE